MVHTCPLICLSWYFTILKDEKVDKTVNEANVAVIKYFSIMQRDGEMGLSHNIPLHDMELVEQL